MTLLAFASRSGKQGGRQPDGVGARSGDDLCPDHRMRACRPATRVLAALCGVSISLSVCCSESQDPIQLAITIDDLPWVGAPPVDGTVVDAVGRIATTLNVHGVPATGMVVCDSARRHPGVVERWVDAGLSVANHTQSHRDLHGSDTSRWLDEMLQCHQTLKRLGSAYLPLLRFPLLHQGLGEAQHRTVRRALAAAQIRVAPVSVDTSEWLIAAAYPAAAGRASDRLRAGRMLSAHVLAALDHADRFARERFGRRPAQILLLHANALLDDHLDRLLLDLREHGVQFISLQDALQDPLYAEPDVYRGTKGLSALYRVDPDGQGASFDDAEASRIRTELASFATEGAGAAAVERSISSMPVGAEPGSKSIRIAKLAGTSRRMRSLVVAQHGCLLLEAYYHGADAGLAANLKSVTKSLSALMVGVAIRRGLLPNEDTGLTEWLPATTPGLANVDGVSLRALLTMSSGLPPVDYGLVQSSQDWVAKTLERPPEDEWTGRFRYDTPVLQLSSAVLRKTFGQSLDQVLKQEFPVEVGQGLKYWRRDPGLNVLGGNDAYLTPRALWAVGELVRAGGRNGSRQVIDAGFLRRATAVQIHTDSNLVNHDTLTTRGYGYLWWLLEVADVTAVAGLGHGGQMLVVFPALDAVVVITSRWPGPSATDHYQHLAHLLESEIVPWLRDAERSGIERAARGEVRCNGSPQANTVDASGSVAPKRPAL